MATADASAADGSATFDRERIPLERFDLQPPSLGGRRLSPVAAMMRGTYDAAMYA